MYLYQYPRYNRVLYNATHSINIWSSLDEHGVLLNKHHMVTEVTRTQRRSIRKMISRRWKQWRRLQPFSSDTWFWLHWWENQQHISVIGNSISKRDVQHQNWSFTMDLWWELLVHAVYIVNKMAEDLWLTF